MKRWPILVSFILFVGLCASATFWAMQVIKPASRPVAFPKPSAKIEVDPETALALFGGRSAPTAVASNFQLKGVVVANNPLESVAILVADSKPAEAVRVNSEVMPGVTVSEVHPQYVLLSDGGVMKRVELPASAPQMHVDSPLGMAQPSPTPAGIIAQNLNMAPPPPPPPQNQLSQNSPPQNSPDEAQLQAPNPPPSMPPRGGHQKPHKMKPNLNNE
jgi:general secretion pathway protein C